MRSARRLSFVLGLSIWTAIAALVFRHSGQPAAPAANGIGIGILILVLVSGLAARRRLREPR